MPEVSLGVIPGFGGTQRLALRVGVARARELIYTGAIIDADEALRIGLVNASRRAGRADAEGARGRGADRGQAPLAVAAAKQRVTPGRCAVLTSRWRAALAVERDHVRRPVRDRKIKRKACGRSSRNARPRVERRMNFDLIPRTEADPGHRARSGAAREIAAARRRRSTAATSSRATIFSRLGELGLLGVMLPEKWGGAGMDALSYAVALEEIARACASTAVAMSVQCSLVCAPILHDGTDAQRTRWLPTWRRAGRSAASRCPSPRPDRTRRRRRTRAAKTADRLGAERHEELHHQRAGRRRHDRLRDDRRGEGQPRHHRVPGADGHARPQGRKGPTTSWGSAARGRRRCS